MRKQSINKRSTERWKSDVRESVLFYNDWFLKFAPVTYVAARNASISKIKDAFRVTDSFNRITKDLIITKPESLSILRMATTPPLARDRLAGLADVSNAFIKALEDGKCPRDSDGIDRIVDVVTMLLDREVMPWLARGKRPTQTEFAVASAILGDRMCGSLADPIIRNEQERRQIRAIKDFLLAQGYRHVEAKDISDCKKMEPGTFAFHLNVPAKVGGRKVVNIPVDVAVMRRTAKPRDLPLFIECKSAGDFTNTNKRRKEEAVKITQLKHTYGVGVDFILFLCGYFDSAYLGYEAAEGIDWVWEHRMSDLEKAGV
jgi:hypothetical protein